MFQFDVILKPSRLNLNTDSLSRSEHLDSVSAAEEAEQREFVATLRSPPFTLSGEEVKRRQLEDDVLAEVREWVKNKQKPPLSTLKGKTADYYIYRQQFEQLSLAEDEVLTIKRPSGPTTLGQIKLVLPGISLCP